MVVPPIGVSIHPSRMETSFVVDVKPSGVGTDASDHVQPIGLVLVRLRVHKDGHIGKVAIVIHYVLQIHTCLCSTIVCEVIGSIGIKLLVRKHRIVVLLLDGRIGDPVRLLLDPFFVHRVNYHLRESESTKREQEKYA